MTVTSLDDNRAESSGATYVFALPMPTPTTLGNISTRLQVGTNDNVLIGGLIVTGTQPKKVLLRAIGPSLPLSGSLANPFLELHDLSGATIASNDNWKDAPNQQEIIDSTIPPSNDLESAILMDLDPGSYTAIVRGVSDSTGIAGRRLRSRSERRLQTGQYLHPRFCPKRRQRHDWGFHHSGR
jgi:hypothetical protein